TDSQPSGTARSTDQIEYCSSSFTTTRKDFPVGAFTMCCLLCGRCPASTMIARDYGAVQPLRYRASHQVTWLMAWRVSCVLPVESGGSADGEPTIWPPHPTA